LKKLPLPLAKAQYISRAIPVLAYIAQLVRPPKNIKILSMDSCAKILRFPGKSLDFDSAHSMHLLGGPQITQIKAYMDSCMARASHKTIYGFEDQYSILKTISVDANFLSRISRSNPCGGSTTPSGWDDRAFCENLCEAKRAFPLHIFSQNNSGKGLQAQCYGHACKAGSPWTKLISRRLKMFQRSDSDDDDSSSSASSSSSSSSGLSSSSSSPNILQGHTCVHLSDIEAVAVKMRLLPEGVRMSYIKTLTNGWATSSRYHEPVLHRCLFGCRDNPAGNKDCLKHYLYCWPLWSAIQDVSGIRVSCNPLLVPPISRLGITNPSLQCILLHALAFRIYHSFKNDHLAQILVARNLGDYSEIMITLKSVAKCHWADLKDHRACGSAPV
jgi:hypothetical protein